MGTTGLTVIWAYGNITNPGLRSGDCQPGFHFTVLAENLGTYGLFYVYERICALGFFFVKAKLKGKPSARYIKAKVVDQTEGLQREKAFKKKIQN